MKKLKKHNPKRLVVVGLILSLVILFCPPGFASNEECDRALARCSVDAMIAGLFSGPQSFLAYSAGCFLGYTWCLKYYDPQN
jgi:hypothetical protein